MKASIAIENAQEILNKIEKAAGDKSAGLPKQTWISGAQSDLAEQAKIMRKPFTVAAIADFDRGKSAVLNALLKEDENFLPEDIQETTALPFRITLKRPSDPEARLIFLDGSKEDVSVERARQMVNLVWLNEHHDDMQKVCQMEEIVVFKDHELLEGLDLLDLPGPGAIEGEERDEIARKKMMAADLILWIYHEEPTGDFERIFLDGLRAGKRKVLCIINVWSDLSNGIACDEAARQADLAQMNNPRYRGLLYGPPVCLKAKEIQRSFKSGSQNHGQTDVDSSGWNETWKWITDIAAIYRRPEERDKTIRDGVALAIQKVLGHIEGLDRSLEDKRTAIGKELGQKREMHNEAIGVWLSARAAVREDVKDWSGSIADQFRSLLHAFIDSKVCYGGLVRTIYDQVTNLTRGKRREAIKQYLQNEFLKSTGLQKKNNWVNKAVASQMHHWIDTINAKWRMLSAKIAEKYGRTRILEDGIHVNEGIIEALVQGIAEIVIATIILVVAVSFFGPLGDTIAISFYALLSIVYDPFKAKRSELKQSAEAAVLDVKFSLTDKVMDNLAQINNDLKEALLKDLGEDRLEKRDRAILDLSANLREWGEDLRKTAAELA